MEPEQREFLVAPYRGSHVQKAIIINGPLLGRYGYDINQAGKRMRVYVRPKDDEESQSILAESYAVARLFEHTGAPTDFYTDWSRTPQQLYFRSQDAAPSERARASETGAREFQFVWDKPLEVPGPGKYIYQVLILRRNHNPTQYPLANLHTSIFPII